MDQKTNGVELYGDTGPLGLKQMLPECFVRVKLETYEDTSCSEPQQYSPSYTKPKSPPKDTVLDQQPITNDCSPQLNSDNLGFSKEPFQVLYQVQLPSHTMQQAQASNQPRSSLAASQGNQINHGPEASHVPQANSSVNRPTNQQPSQASGSHQFPHSRPSEITWLSHPYVDQNTQHFHTHQMQYVPNDAGLLSTLPGTQDGARLVKQNPESQGGSSAVGCRGDSNAGNIASVPGNDSGDSNAFISYVLSPQRGVPSSGIFLFDASRGLSSQSTQIQSTNREDGSQIDVQSSRSIDETVRESSSDSANTSGSTKSGESHLVSRSCQTIVTMSQIQDAPLLSDTKIIITGTPAPELASEPEDSKDKVFAEVDGNTYSSQQALVNHERYHRGERPYECEVCHKAFATNSHLVTHRRTHTGERPFQCQLCQRCFADRSAFVKHERTHGPNGSIIKRYKCNECGSGFVDSCGLKKHIRIHTGERPYVCSVCSKTFSTSSTFVAHKRIHTGERPYKCESCDKMFITKSHLLTHRRTHTGEKPFTCSVCHRCFTDGSSFRRHERLHTGENRHICMQCGRGFPLESSLLKHKQTHIQSSTFSYVYENRNDLNCIASPSQQPQDNCDASSDPAVRVSIPHVGENTDRGICVDLSREIPGEVVVNRNNLCTDAPRDIDCDNQSAHSTVRVVG